MCRNANQTFPTLLMSSCENVSVKIRFPQKSGGFYANHSTLLEICWRPQKTKITANVGCTLNKIAHDLPPIICFVEYCWMFYIVFHSTLQHFF